eukprot:CAMPEP_0119305000 /NCGR_PEP_ID=MMETSP1333-20130426/6096_1 /TAXON_ID=418940 /ORGANISM="Scyphosphaera apsteinii, Strain RCC1455" /LENGTH=64 /DNA_ID=CAMNT_0007307995 /DNA_START=387 /DNA_END=581 /DNA_ORIENTATION=-
MSLSWITNRLVDELLEAKLSAVIAADRKDLMSKLEALQETEPVFATFPTLKQGEKLGAISSAYV